jgi:CheY-like chemotaxis protein
MGRQERILVVEDNAQLRNMLIKALDRLGYQVLEASNGLIAQRMIELGERFDLVLSDVIMPGLGGIELMLWIHEHSPEQRILLMSGHTGNAADAMNDTMNMEKWSAILLRKPFTIELLAQKVYGMLAAP